MLDAKRRDAATRKDDDEQVLSKRQSEATSGETLSDLKDDEKISGPVGERGSGPSPDGQLDETEEMPDAGPI